MTIYETVVLVQGDQAVNELKSLIFGVINNQ